MKKIDLRRFLIKLKIEAFIKSIIVGFSLSLLFNSLLIILFKIIPVKIITFVHILAFVALSIIFTIVLYYKVFKENEIQVANRIEKYNKLNESVKTMIEFKNVDEPMVNLQREKAMEEIERLSSKNIKMNFSFSNFIFSIIGIVFLVVSTFIPIREVTVNSNSNNSSSENSDINQTDSSSDNPLDETLIKITSDIDAQIVLKEKSYDKFSNNKWNLPTLQFDSTSFVNNPSYLVGNALKNNDYESNLLTIEKVSSDSYYLPYYTAGGNRSVTTDSYLLPSDSPSYTLSFISFDYFQEGIVKDIDSKYLQLEDKYSEFVHANYLSIPQESMQNLEFYAKESGIEKKDPNVISKVINYLQSILTYDQTEDIENLDPSKEIVDYYLKTVLKGNQVVYATIATLMLRYFDVPARYSEGLKVDVVANQTINIDKSNFFSFVEVYIDDFGWVYLDVTNPVNETILKVTSNVDTTIYLKGQSYGNYNGLDFDEVAVEYESDLLNPLYLTSEALNGRKTSMNNVEIDVVLGNKYYIPTYASTYVNSLKESQVTEDYTNLYNVSYYTYNYFNEGKYDHSNESIIDMEKQYYEHVKDTYLDVPSNISNEIQSVIENIKSNLSREIMLYDIVNYFHENEYVYDESIKSSHIPTNNDVITYFLNESKSGDSKLFAMATTLMYRYCGIPARYVNGIKASLIANQQTEISSTSGWVEVYIEHMGWIEIDPTVYIPKIMFYVTSSVDAQVHFRQGSYDTYNLSFFDVATSSFDSSNLLDNPLNLTGKALENNGQLFENITIDTVDAQNYYTTYYTNNAPTNQKTDYMISDVDYSSYLISYTTYDYFTLGVITHTDLQYIEFEKKYYEYVKQQYTLLPETTKQSMDTIIRENEINISSETIISDIKNYITSTISYNPEITYESYPEGTDSAIYVLTEGLEGDAALLATAATVMYRAAGIPARVAVGLSANLVANETTPVYETQGSIWVEVYVENMGWIEVQVAPNNGQGSGGENGEDDNGEESPGTGDGQEGEGEEGEKSDNPADGETSGDGDMIYSSDDLIYDPATDSYVTYGELITWYYSQVMQGLQEGELPEDIESLVNDYFSSLYNDENESNQDSENEN